MCNPLIECVCLTFAVSLSRARAVCSKHLSKHQFSVATAEDGVEALEVLEALRERQRCGDVTARPFDLILLDLIMPRMDGKAVLTRLKDDPEVCSLPAAGCGAVWCVPCLLQVVGQCGVLRSVGCW